MQSLAIEIGMAMVQDMPETFHSSHGHDHLPSGGDRMKSRKHRYGICYAALVDAFRDVWVRMSGSSSRKLHAAEIGVLKGSGPPRHVSTDSTLEDHASIAESWLSGLSVSSIWPGEQGQF
eukprot:6462868-Amphidinium_carterae.1